VRGPGRETTRKIRLPKDICCHVRIDGLGLEKNTPQALPGFEIAESGDSGCSTPESTDFGSCEEVDTTWDDAGSSDEDELSVGQLSSDDNSSSKERTSGAKRAQASVKNTKEVAEKQLQKDRALAMSNAKSDFFSRIKPKKATSLASDKKPSIQSSASKSKPQLKPQSKKGPMLAQKQNLAAAPDFSRECGLSCVPKGTTPQLSDHEPTKMFDRDLGAPMGKSVMVRFKLTNAFMWRHAVVIGNSYDAVIGDRIEFAFAKESGDTPSWYRGKIVEKAKVMKVFKCAWDHETE